MLCNGTGVPTNLSYWAFSGQGGPFSITFNVDPTQCQNNTGIQAGLFTVCTGAGVLDCYADCLANSFTLNASPGYPCAVIYLWVDGCGGDVCPYTISVSGSTSAPNLPNPMPNIEFKNDPCVGQYLGFCFPGFGIECWPNVEWEVDGVPYGTGECQEFKIINEGQIEVCYTATLGFSGNTCHQVEHCEFYSVQVEKRVGKLRRICPRVDGYEWHGSIIQNDCINPPCTARVQLENGCLVDSIVPFMIRTPEIRLGSKVNVPIQNQPYYWHGELIENSCVNPPCTARVEIPNGCLVDSVKQIEILRLPDGMSQVQGKVYFDLDNNCNYTSREPGLGDIRITLEGQNNTFQTLTNASGTYNILVPVDNYTIQAFDINEMNFACPVSVDLDVDRDQDYFNLNFYKPDSSCYPGRLKISPLTGNNRLRCDRFNRALSIIISNTSIDTLPEDSIKVLVDDLMKMESSNFPFNLVSDNEIRVGIPSVPPGERIIIEIEFSSDCGPANEHDMVCFTAQYLNGYSCNGNILGSSYCGVITVSKDPNDLTMTPYGVLAPRYIEKDQDFTGLIRFHNDGSGIAYDVDVDLELSFDKVDATSIKLLGTSAEGIKMSIEDGGLRFEMPNIELPPNQDDSINSHGYILYAWRPHPNVSDWDEIEQQAFIYFDDNAAVPTNIELQTIEGDYFNRSNEIIVCQGDTINNVIILQDTVFVDTLVQEGPDLITSLYVYTIPTFETEVDTQILAGDEIHGIRIYRDTVMTFDFIAQNGCDSLVTYIVETSATSAQDLINAISIYPNPAKSDVLYISNCPQELSGITFIDANGKTWDREIQLGTTCQIDISKLPTGVYLYRLTSASGIMSTGKLSVQK